jgi:hypothetical protein
MDDLLRAPIEAETTATCHDCAMCAAADAPADPDTHYFNPRVKCCTFLPHLRNFLVGRILLDPDPAMARGQRSVEARIAAGSGVTPLGLGRSGTSPASDEGSGFGRDEALLCPHYVREGGGLCGIWPHREATCATFFCKHDRGAVGAAFWQALRRLLEAVEQSLAWHCVEALDVGRAAVSRLLDPSDSGTTLTTRSRQDLWGRWAGRERAFYEAAASLVSTMSWEQVRERGGSEVRQRAERTRDAHARLRSTAVPAGPLRLRPMSVTPLGPRGVRLVTYSGDDPLIVPRELHDVLPRFEGFSMNDALARLREEAGLEIDPAAVRRLIDFDVLAAAGESPDDGPEPATPA